MAVVVKFGMGALCPDKRCSRFPVALYSLVPRTTFGVVWAPAYGQASKYRMHRHRHHRRCRHQPRRFPVYRRLRRI